MGRETKGRIIATRKLVRIDPDGSKHRVRVQIERPTRGKRSFTCRFRIKNLDDRKSRWVSIYGVDEWQALLMAVHIVHAWLYFRRNKDAQLFWLGSQNLGIPFTSGAATDNRDENGEIVPFER